MFLNNMLIPCACLFTINIKHVKHQVRRRRMCLVLDEFEMSVKHQVLEEQIHWDRRCNSYRSLVIGS